jgi:hypothetical protein
VVLVTGALMVSSINYSRSGVQCTRLKFVKTMLMVWLCHRSTINNNR